MSLLAEERKKRIQELIGIDGKVRVNELAVKFDVSTETIRRYLEDLESEKKLRKVHGGAVKLEMEVEEPSLFERNILRIEEKKKIGKLAADFVQDGDVIFVDEGSTTLQLASALTNIKNLTILTNSFPLATVIMKFTSRGRFTGDLIFLGGHVSSKHFRSSGSLAERMAKDFYVNKSFISVDGVHPTSGVTSFDLEKCLLSKLFINNADETLILTDHTKLGTRANYKMSSFKNIHCVICDVPSPTGWEIPSVNWVSP